MLSFWPSGGERCSEQIWGLRSSACLPDWKRTWNNAHLWGSFKQKQQLQNLLIPQREKLFFCCCFFFLHASCVQCRMTKQWCTIVREREWLWTEWVSYPQPSFLGSNQEPSDSLTEVLLPSYTNLLWRRRILRCFFTNPTVVKRWWTVSNPERTEPLWATRRIKYPWTSQPALRFMQTTLLLEQSFQ